jgi:formylglycine-generating enzyme required for sulfatase activity
LLDTLEALHPAKDLNWAKQVIEVVEQRAGLLIAREELWTEGGWEWREKQQRTRPDDFGTAFQTPNHPRVGVTWYEAVAFCNWLNLVLTPQELKLPDEQWKVRLPGEAEWERAAGHTDGREFSWKPNDKLKPASLCNYWETQLGQTTAAGLFPSGQAECGAHDLAGNVWEWTRSLWGRDWQKAEFNYPYKPGDGRESLEAPGDVLRVLRGGSWGYVAYSARCAYRFGNVPGNRYRNVGFRVVASPFCSER